MKKTLEEWEKAIVLKEVQKDDDCWIVSWCPVCGECEHTPVRGERSLWEKKMAKNKVRSHIQTAHRDVINKA